jgi:hypothetical protein
VITIQDAEFHRGRSDDPQWTETLWFPFAVPEKAIYGGFYLVARPNLGVIMCDVSVQDRLADSWDEALYVDNQQHLPCPESLLDFSLPNGYSVKVIEPLKRYELRYDGYDDTRFDLTFDALMHPYDMNDPAIDPLAGARNGGGWDASFNGHYEVTGRIKGNARIRGVDHAIDYVDTGDRSWGVRKERATSTVAWFHGSFGDGLTFHVLAATDPARSKSFIAPISGYILDQGEVHGMTALEGDFTMRGVVVTSANATITDARGKTFRFTGTALSTIPWAPCPNALYAQSMMRWEYEGQTGYGTLQQGLDRGYLTKNRDLFKI